MKIIEGMRLVKENKEKIADLTKKVSQYSANTSFDKPAYGTSHGDTKKQITSWLQSIHDLTLNNIKVLNDIAYTNLVTKVDIQLGEVTVTKSIAAWIWRRREYAAMDFKAWQQLTDKGLKPGFAQNSSPGVEPMKIEVVLNYDTAEKDAKLALYHSEAHRINSTLEVVNATTDLLTAP